MNLAEKTILNILAKSSHAVGLIISSIVMVRYFSKDQYGTFLQIMLISNTALMFTSLGVPQSIYYFFQQTSSRKRFVVRNVLFSIVISSITAGLVYTLKVYLAKWLNNPDLITYAWVIPLLIFSQSLSGYREPILISHGNLVLNSALVFSGAIIFFVPLIIATVLSVSLLTLLKVMLISSGVGFCTSLGSIWWLIFHIKEVDDCEFEQEPSPVKEVSLKEQLWYALPIGVSSYMNIIGRQIDQYIVSAFFTPEHFAVYSRGAMRIPMLSTVQFTINNVMMPTYVKAYQAGDIKTFLDTYHLCIEKVAKINFPVFSLLFAITPSIVTLLYTEEYLGAVPIFRVYLCLLFLTIAVYGVIPRASGQTACIMYATLSTIIVNIILSLLLITRYGPVGAAIATVASEIVAAGYYLFQSCKILNISFGRIFPWKYIFQLLSASLAASIPVYCIEHFFTTNTGSIFFRLLFEGLLYSYCWIFLAMRIDLIYQDDFEMVQKWLRFDVKRALRKITFLS